MENLKIQMLEKVGYVGSCLVNPAEYASSIASYRTPAADTVANYALSQLQAMREKDIAMHAINEPRIEINKKIHALVGETMKSIDMPSQYSEKDTKSRARYSKTITHTAGYLLDLKREASIDDGFLYATQTYERLKARYEEYAEKANKEAENLRAKQQRDQEEKERARRDDMELAQILLRYELDVMSSWGDVVEALRAKDKYLDLVIGGMRVRGDWSDGPYEARAALDRFTMETDQDKKIVTDWIDCLTDFEDGRVFRDTEWNYVALQELVNDKQLLSDCLKAESKRYDAS